MTDIRELAVRFFDLLQARDGERLGELLHEDIFFRSWRWDGRQTARGRAPTLGLLMDEWSAWPDPTLRIYQVLLDGARATVELRIQATEGGRYVEHERSALMAWQDGLLSELHLYCAAPLPSARRRDWIAAASLAPAELDQVWSMFQYRFDVREWLMGGFSSVLSVSPGFWRGTSKVEHPGANIVGSARFTEQEADGCIKEQIAFHRDRGLGFQWMVGPRDTPADLGQRLLKHGLVYAGDEVLMARVGLDELDIPTNPRVEVELLDGTDEEALEAALQISAHCFHQSKEQVDTFRPSFFERVRSPEFRKRELNFLARLDGVPAAEARLLLTAGIAYLGGAATLPEYRSQKVYSTLLRRRLEEARALGYQIAAIHSAPMSRRVVSRYGFEPVETIDVYAWMPVIDMEVIRKLIVDD